MVKIVFQIPVAFDVNQVFALFSSHPVVNELKDLARSKKMVAELTGIR